MDDLTRSLIKEVKSLRQRVADLEGREEDRRDANGVPIYPTLTAGRVVVTGASKGLATDNALVWDNTNKRLGVGLTGPTARVHIAVANAETDTVAGDYIRFDVAGGLVARLYRNYNGSQNYLGLESFNVGNTVKTPIVLQEFGGNVGIGTAAPSQRLHVVGNSLFGGPVGINRSPAADVTLTTNSTTNTSSTYALVARNASDGNLMYLRGDGLAWVNQNWTIGSDLRMKDQLENLPVGRNALRSLLPRRYRLRRRRADGTEELSAKQHYGFVAQELQAVMPDLVEETPDGLAIRYGDLIPVLVKALQEQDAELETLKATVEEQQRTIEQLTRAVEALQRRQQP